MHKMAWGLLFAIWLFGFDMAGAEYQVEPVRQELSLKAGKLMGNSSFAVTNTGQEPIRLKVTLYDWNVDEKGQLTYSSEPQENSIQPFIRINPLEFEIQPGRLQTVRFLVALPTQTKEGEYRSMFMLEDVKTSTQHHELLNGKNAALEIKKRLGLALYVYHGNPTIKASVEQNHLEIRDGQLWADLQLRNTGLRSAQLDSRLSVSKKDANEPLSGLSDLKIPELQNLFILPGRQRQWQGVLLDNAILKSLQSGQYQLDCTFISRRGQPTQPIRFVSGFEVP